MTAGDGGTVTVRVDETLRDLVPHYLANRRNDVERLREALSREDFEAIRILGHSMAGSGGGYGFPTLTRIGRMLEKAGKERDRASVESQLQELSNYLRRVVVEFVPER
jgi:HPt (histidine-containing phosphotransfer) domain-containing protein